MHRILLSVVATAAVSFAGGALAADGMSGSEAAQSDPNEVVCKDAKAETGSMLGHRRICMTRLQWQQQQQDDRAEVDRAQLHSLDSRPPGG